MCDTFYSFLYPINNCPNHRIIALFAGLLSAFCALLFLDSFPQICPANMYVILAICGVVSVITVAVFTQCMPATIATLAALALAMVFHVLFERYIAVPTQYSIYIAANIFFVLIGAIIGAVLGTKYRKVSMKLTGAVMGSFLIVASIGVVIDEFSKGVQTHFNLWEFAVNPKGFVNKCGQITSGGGGTNAFVIMFVAWIVLSVCSLVYQVWLQSYVNLYI